jgi:hypothetical protein
VKVSVPSFTVPRWEIVGVTFSENLSKAYVAYQFSVPAKAMRPSHLVPHKIVINGKDVSRSSRILQVADRLSVGMLTIPVGGVIQRGQPVHVRLEFEPENVTQCILRASADFLVDAFGVAENESELRKQLNLDTKPAFQMIASDPACTDDVRCQGYSAQEIISARDALFRANDTRSAYVYLCTAARPQVNYAIYGQISDSVACNPYCMNYGHTPDGKFIEQEENYFRWAWLAARPHPWLWFPEAHVPSRATRMLEPEELRLLVFAAIGHGVRGVNYYSYGTQTGIQVGFEQSPSLSAEIKRLNKELQLLKPLLSIAFPVSIETVGSQSDGLRIYTLWCPEKGVMVIVRNLNYSTDRESNSFGTARRFKPQPKHDVQIVLAKPPWLKLAGVIDPITGEKLMYRNGKDKIQLAFKDVNLIRIALARNL